MRGEQGCTYRDRCCIAELPCNGEHLELGFDVQAVAGLDLDRRDAFGGERLNPGQGGRVELVRRSGPRGVDRREDAAAGSRDVLVARAFQAPLELTGTIAGEYEVRVAVDECRCYPAAAERAYVAGSIVREIRERADPPDDAVARRSGFRDDGAVLDDAVVGTRHRRDIQVCQQEVHCIEP